MDIGIYYIHRPLLLIEEELLRIAIVIFALHEGFMMGTEIISEKSIPLYSHVVRRANNYFFFSFLLENEEEFIFIVSLF